MPPGARDANMTELEAAFGPFVSWGVTEPEVAALMGPPDYQTVEYEGPLPTGPEREHVRVALVGGSGSGREEDFYRLLRRRLRIFVSFYAITYAVAVVIVGVASIKQGPATGSGGDGFFTDLWGERGDWLPLSATVVSVVAAAVLWLRPPASVSGLRAVELAFVAYYVVGMLVATAHPRTYRDLERAADKPPDWAAAEIGAYAGAMCLLWFQFLVMYSVLIPNTGRRNAVVVVGTVVAWLVEFAILSVWVKPLPGQTVFRSYPTSGSRSVWRPPSASSPPIASNTSAGRRTRPASSASTSCRRNSARAAWARCTGPSTCCCGGRVPSS